MKLLKLEIEMKMTLEIVMKIVEYLEKVRTKTLKLCENLLTDLY